MAGAGSFRIDGTGRTWRSGASDSDDVCGVTVAMGTVIG